MTTIVSKLGGCKESVYLRFICNGDIQSILFEMIQKGYSPAINHQSGSLLSLTFKVDKIVGTITQADITCPNNIQIQIANTKEYTEYQKADKEFYGSVIQEKYKSTYHPSVIEIENQYPKGPIVGRFVDEHEEDSDNEGEEDYYVDDEVDGVSEKETFNAVDMRKAYTDCLMRLTKIPIFGYFDTYKPYDKHQIEDYNMYIVQYVSKNVLETVLFPEEYHRCFGYKLNRCKAKVKIMYFMRPSKLVDVDFKDDVKKLFSMKSLPMELRKFISNKTTGLLEKKKNRKSLSKVFRDADEMLYYQMKYGGRYYILKNTILGEDGAENTEERLYLLTFTKDKPLTEGFRHIKELIYDVQTIKLKELYETLAMNNIKPYGCNTDCIFIKENYDAVKDLFDFKDEIGYFKFETDKTIKCKKDSFGLKIQQDINDVPNVPIQKIKDIAIKDEFNEKEVLDIFKENNKVLVLGTLPGVGKTSAVKLLAKNGQNVLFVTPYNKLCQEHRKDKIDAVTFNKLTNTFIDGKEHKNRTSAYDVSSYNHICFDEAFMYSPIELKKIAQYMNAHPDKTYSATGDMDQLKPFGTGLTNVIDYKDYVSHCISSLFGNKQFTLRINKRLRDEEEREKLNQLKVDVFDKSKDIMETLRDFGFKIVHKLSEVTTNTNICFFNFRAKMVSKHIQKLLLDENPIDEAEEIGGLKYYKGMNLICNKHFQSKKTRVYVNYEYKVMEINNKTFTIQDVVEGEKITLPIAMISTNFKLPYGLTCHSVQGLSLDGPMTIFDVNCAYVSREFIWTAITRARSLENVQIFQHCKAEVKSLYESKLKQYLSFKVAGYKEQDKAKNRTWKKDDYVTEDWINDQFAQCQTCECCKKDMELYVDENGEVKSNITVDRIDSKLSHVQNNCRLLCYHCNCKTGKETKTVHNENCTPYVI